MPDPRLDVLCIGNAIVDVIANASDEFLAREGLVKGSMRLINAEEAERLYSHMGPAHQVSGGSAGNTAAGIAALGGVIGVAMFEKRKGQPPMMPPQQPGGYTGYPPPPGGQPPTY